MTELSPKHAAAVEALLVHQRVADAAAAVGVSERTLWRWLAMPDFRQALADAEAARLAATVRALVRAADGAVTTLVAIMNDASEPPAARLKAASLILENVATLRTLGHIESRLAALELETR